MLKYIYNSCFYFKIHGSCTSVITTDIFYELVLRGITESDTGCGEMLNQCLIKWIRVHYLISTLAYSVRVSTASQRPRPLFYYMHLLPKCNPFRYNAVADTHDEHVVQQETHFDPQDNQVPAQRVRYLQQWLYSSVSYFDFSCNHTPFKCRTHADSQSFCFEFGVGLGVTAPEICIFSRTNLNYDLIHEMSIK